MRTNHASGVAPLVRSWRRLGGLLLVLCAVVSIAGCGERETEDPAAGRDTEVVPVAVGSVVEQPLARFVRVSGTLAAQEEASVAAEVAGRVVATPIERGTRVAAEAVLIRVADDEVAAQAREAEANVAQIQARLGTASGASFDVERVAEVASARASSELADRELDRARMLQERQLVSRSEFDQRRLQAEAARRQYEVARNAAEQQHQGLIGAQARLALARKAVADTTVRAPFDGVVAERLVSVGDYVTRGTKVASVMRTSPLRLELTVPAQYVRAMAIGRAVTLEVDAYAGESFTGEVRYVSPAVQFDTRALVVEAEVPNADGRLKPGLFATARIELAATSPALLVPAAAVQRTATATRVFVVEGDTAEERLITTGQAEGDLVEVTSGLRAGERVVMSGVERVSDGARVRAGS
jgi:RND family efflux transporter MFP subunit